MPQTQTVSLTRDKFVPLIDLTRGAEAGTYDWAPIDLSTIFEFAFNPSTETYSYICYPNDVTEITSYAPSMEQEIKITKDNPIYDFMLAYMREMPTGDAAKVPLMVVWPDKTTGASTVADVWDDAIVSPGSVNTVDGKLTFTLNFNGDRTTGTVSGIGTDTVTFTPGSGGVD